MNRLSVYLSIFFLLVLIWLTLRAREPAERPAMEPSTHVASEDRLKASGHGERTSKIDLANATAPTKGALAQPSMDTSAPTLGAVTPPPTDQAAHKPPPRAVPFKKIGEFVVAYGDVLLGKPKSTDFPASGFIEVAPPRRWDQGIIPFSIHDSLPDPQRVLRVIAYLNEFSTVRFVPFQGQPDSLVFLPLAGECLSYLGRTGGAQPVYLDDRCGDHEITHELMHALGFIHEHSRLDRDQYVDVNWQNIEPEHRDQFDLTPIELNEPVRDRPFDYHSVMIYSGSAFALDRSVPTLSARGDTRIEPTSQGLSPEDLERVRRLYPR